MAKKILIAEDEASILVSLEFLMRKAGYEVRSVTRGDQVLPSLREFVPDLILLDVMLPKRNGFELCHDIRANAEWSQVRILILSAKGGEQEVKRGIDAGADAYVTKPFATHDLQESVRQLIGQAG